MAQQMELCKLTMFVTIDVFEMRRIMCIPLAILYIIYTYHSSMVTLPLDTFRPISLIAL
jgi:hypothetical protein